MRALLLLPFLLVLACTGHTDRTPKVAGVSSQILNQIQVETGLGWTGLIGNDTAVFLHYSLQDSVVVGEMTFLNDKDRKPVKILGSIDKNNEYRLLEFEPDGNIAAIIRGKPEAESCTGVRFITQTRQEQQIRLTRKDTVIANPDLQPEADEIFGEYYYQYSEDGYQGDFSIKKVGNNRAVFNIFSVTDRRRGGNIADVPEDTVTVKGNSFIYSIPESEDCEFRVTFYKGFLTVNYTNGYCPGQFGMNATVDGIYLKVNR